MPTETTDRECVEFARECVRLARLVQDLEVREQLIDMAREWMAAAMREVAGGPRKHSRRPVRRLDVSSIN